MRALDSARGPAGRAVAHEFRAIMFRTITGLYAGGLYSLVLGGWELASQMQATKCACQKCDTCRTGQVVGIVLPGHPRQ
jgi:hypothetical protein